MMFPRVCASAGTAYLIPWNTPVTLTSNSRANSSSEISGIGLPISMPALLTITSRPPKASTVSAIARCTSLGARSRRSVSAIASPPIVLGGLLRRGAVEVGQRDARAALGEQLRDREAEPAARRR